VGRAIEFEENQLVLKLTGLTGFFALKTRLAIPYQTIKHIFVEYFDAPRWMLRMPGTSIAPLNIFEGSYKYANEWYFLSYENRVPLVVLELEGHKKYSYVIFQMDDPGAAAHEIRQKVREYQERVFY